MAPDTPVYLLRLDRTGRLADRLDLAAVHRLGRLKTPWAPSRSGAHAFGRSLLAPVRISSIKVKARAAAACLRTKRNKTRR